MNLAPWRRVACRMYRTDTGLAGAPVRDHLREALRASALA